jgi:hypothetical protein
VVAYSNQLLKRVRFKAKEDLNLSNSFTDIISSTKKLSSYFAYRAVNDGNRARNKKHRLNLITAVHSSPHARTNTYTNTK